MQLLPIRHPDKASDETLQPAKGQRKAQPRRPREPIARRNATQMHPAARSSAAAASTGCEQVRAPEQLCHRQAALRLRAPVLTTLQTDRFQAR
jgi:hypothetical protein